MPSGTGLVSGPAWPNKLIPPVLSAGQLSQVAGGVLAQTTYFVVITYVNAKGETLQSNEQSLLVNANNVLAVASPLAEDMPLVSGDAATGWNVYVGTASGNETKQNGAAINIGTNWQEPNTGLIAGVVPPVQDSSLVAGFKSVTHY